MERISEKLRRELDEKSGKVSKVNNEKIKNVAISEREAKIINDAILKAVRLEPFEDVFKPRISWIKEPEAYDIMDLDFNQTSDEFEMEKTRQEEIMSLGYYGIPVNQPNRSFITDYAGI